MRLSPLGARFVQSLISSLIALWVIAALASFFFDVRHVYTLSALGLLFAGQATFYKYRLWRDPEYTIRNCNCGGSASQRMEKVLSSRSSSFLKIPNSVLGAAGYVAVASLSYSGRTGAALIVAVLALVASAYLARVMVSRIRGLCPLCISASAVNLWLVWYLAT